jgi:hypothetical protein
MTASREAPVTEDYATKRCIHSSCAHIVFRDQELSGGKIPCRSCGCTDHRAGPYAGHDPQTPPGAEAALETFKTMLEEAGRELAAAVDEEVTAELARDAAMRKWMFDKDCPPVGVFNGVRTTVAQRDAWVAGKIVDEERAYRLAKAAREAAQTKLDILGRQGSYQQSISRSVSEVYRNTGRDPW